MSIIAGDGRLIGAKVMCMSNAAPCPRRTSAQIPVSNIKSVKEERVRSGLLYVRRDRMDY